MKNIQARILALLRRDGPCHRDYMTLILETPRTTIFDNLTILEARGEVHKKAYNDHKRGRSFVLWKEGATP